MIQAVFIEQFLRRGHSGDLYANHDRLETCAGRWSVSQPFVKHIGRDNDSKITQIRRISASLASQKGAFV